MSIALLKLVYFANIIVAGWISFSCLFWPKTAMTTVFTSAFNYSESFRLVGALWAAIFLLSILEQQVKAMIYKILRNGFLAAFRIAATVSCFLIFLVFAPAL